jgi:hypothetical protein
MSSTELAMVRNRLLNGRFDDRDELLLSHIRSAAQDGGSTFASMIVDGIDEALVAARSSDMLRAGSELNLVHNLPLTVEDESSWDIAHFLQFELPTYLEQDISVARAKRVLAQVVEVLDALEVHASGSSGDQSSGG